MNQTGDCLLYSGGVYGFHDAPAVVGCRGRDHLSYGGTEAVPYSDGDAMYRSVDSGVDIYNSRSRCRDNPTVHDYRHTSSYFGGGGRTTSTVDLAYACSGNYSAPSAVQGDCYGGFPTPYGERRVDCAVNEDVRLIRQSSTLDDGVPRPCNSLQPGQQPGTHHDVHQPPQLTRLTTYKWMTVKRGPPRTTGACL